MDGLMLDTERLNMRLWVEVFQELFPDHPRQRTEVEYQATLGLNRTNSMEYLARIYPDYDVQEVYRRFEERIDSRLKAGAVEVKPGLPELLDELEHLHIPKMVATSSGRDYARRLLEGSGIWQRMDGMVFGDMVVNSKPDPEIFLLAAGQAGVSPEHCMVLEDSFAGITAAHRAGMLPVMVPDILQPTPELEALLYRKCQSLLDVIPLLREQAAYIT